MSEQAHDKHRRNETPQGQSDLSELNASKDLHLQDKSAPANQLDLTSASISAINVPRLTERPSSTRTERSNVTTSNDVTTVKSGSIVRAGTSASSRETPGIFTNPTYRYQGGLLSKLITFVANVLKVLERILLGLLGIRDKSAQRHQLQTKPAAKESVQTPKNQKSRRDSKSPEGKRVHRS